MKIKFSSWHYKYIAKRWQEHPHALCWYFWKIILSIALWMAAGVLAIIVGIGALALLAFPIWHWFFDYDADIPAISLALWMVIGILVSMGYRRYLYDSKQLKRKKHVYKEPSLVSQYIHAKHRKICPLLEYTNE